MNIHSTARENIDTYGGKAASLIHQYTHGNKEFLLPMSIYTPSMIELSWRLQKAQMDILLRSSIKGDENGYVGIIPNYNHGMPNPHVSVESSIRTLFEETGSQIDSRINSMIKNYRTYFDGINDYKNLSSVIAMPEVDIWSAPHMELNHCMATGSITNHPTIKDAYIASILDGRYEFLLSKDGDLLQSSQFVGDTIAAKVTMGGHRLKMRNQHNSTLPLDNIIIAALDMKIKTDKANFMSGIATQTEFLAIGGDRGKKILNDITQDSHLYQYANHTPEYDSYQNIFFVQQRAFLPYSYDPSIDPKNYRFNTIGEFPYQIKNLIRLNHADSNTQPNSDFILQVDSRFIEAYDNVSLGSNGGKMADGEWSKKLALFNSPFLKGIQIGRGNRVNYLSMGHGAFRILTKGVPLVIGGR